MNVVDLITWWFFPFFPFLANYLWMARLPLTKWHINSFLSSSNHAVILSLFFLFLMCHQSHQSIFLYFVHQYLFPFEFLSISFLVMPPITQFNFSCLEKRMKKANNNRDYLWRLKKNEEMKQQSWLTGAGLPYLIFPCFLFPC